MRSLIILGFLSLLLATTAAIADISVSGNGWDASGHGNDGGNASPIQVQLWEDGEKLYLEGYVGQNSVKKSTNATGETVYLNAIGGDGSNGYDGNDGYDGAPGYDGRDGYSGEDGYPGRDGRDGTRHSPNGEDGERGGEGGDGGPGEDGTDGGDGGPGEDAGNGGHGGDGASIVVESLTTDLWMHVAARYYGGDGGRGGSGGSGGDGGRAGQGGDGGRGGYGGAGGRGGRGYRCSEDEKQNGCVDGSDGSRGRRGWSGDSGRDGRDGSSGRRGSDGDDGSNGYDGSRGSITFHLVDAAGKVLLTHNSSEIYNLKVQSFSVSDENGDGIYEPGEKFTLSNIKIKNVGTLDAPEGSSVAFGGSFKTLNQNLQKLPKIKKGATHSLSGTLTGEISIDQPVGRNLRVSSGVQFRGLSFPASDSSQDLLIQYPIQLTNIESQEFIPFGKKHTLKITLKNISSKAHGNLGLSYSQDGLINSKVVNQVTSLKAGESKVETLEYIAEQGIKFYHRTNLSAQVFRDHRAYANQNISWQVVPDYKFNADSDLLILANQFPEDSFNALTAWMQKAGFSYDIFDTRRYAKADNVLDTSKYSKKIVFFAKGSGPVTGLQTTVQKLLDGSNAFLSFADGLSLNKTTDYTIRSVRSSQNFFRLSVDKQVAAFQKGLFDAMESRAKRSKARQYITAGHKDFLPNLADAIIKEIDEEMTLAKKNSKLYGRKANPIVKQFDEHIKSLHAYKNFDERVFFASLVPSMLAFDPLNPIRRRSAFRKLKSIIKHSIAVHETTKELPQSCEKLIGVFVNEDGKTMPFKKWSKTLKGEYKVQDPNRPDRELKLRFKTKYSEGLNWQLEYKIKRTKHQATAQMTCDGAKIGVNLTLPHSGDQIHFLKASTIHPDDQGDDDCRPRPGRRCRR